MRRPGGTLLLLCAAVIMAACGDGGASLSSQKPARSDEATPASVPPTHSVAPSPEPTAADVDSSTAEEFVAHWFELVNRAYVTGDVSALQEASSSSCKTCESTIATIREQYATGGSFRGGEISVELAVASAPSETGTSIISAQIDQAPLRKIARDGSEGDVSDGESDLLLSLAAMQTPSGWILASVSAETS